MCTQKYDVTFIGQAYGERPDIISFLIQNNINIKVFGIGWKNFDENLKAKKNNIYLEKLTKLFSKNIIKAIKYKFHYLLHPEDRILVEKNSPLISKAKLPSKHIGDILTDDQVIKTYSKSKINLGLLTCGNTHKEDNIIKQIRLREFEIPMAGGFYMTEYIEELEEFFDIDKEIVCYHDKYDMLDKIKFYLKHDSLRGKIAYNGQKRCLKDHSWQKRFKTIFDRIQGE